MKFLVVGSPHAVSTRDVWKGVMKGLAENGHSVQSYDVYPRFEMFQHFTTWLEEKEVKVYGAISLPTPQLLAYEPVLWAAVNFEVDVVLFVSPQYLPLGVPPLLKKAGFPCWAWMTESPYEDTIYAVHYAELFDACFINDLYSLNYWRLWNKNTHYIPHSFDPRVHFPAWSVPEGRRERKHDINEHQHVVYVGSGFTSRIQYLEEADWSGIDLRLYGNWPLAFAAKKDDDPLRDMRPPVDSPVAQYVRFPDSAVDNTFTARLYRGSAIGFNIHRVQRYREADSCAINEDEAYSMGPRSVELAACGCFQLSDYRREVVDVFGSTVPIYQNPAELEQLTRKYLNDPVRRRELAVQQHEAIKGRTFRNNVGRALELAGG